MYRSACAPCVRSVLLMYGAEAAPLIEDQSWFSSRMTKTVLMWLLTLTCTGSDAEAVPDPSSARSVKTCDPFATEKLSQVAANGAAVTVATVVPSRTKSTCAVPEATVALSATGPDTTAPLLSPENAGGVFAGGVGGVGGAGGVGSGTVGSGVTVPASDPGAVAEVWGSEA